MAESIYELNIMDQPHLPFRILRQMAEQSPPLPNWHENTEVLYCHHGSGYFQYNESCYSVVPGDMVVINSEMLHCVYTDTTMEFYCLILDRHFCTDSGIPTTTLNFQEFIRDDALSSAFLEVFSIHERYMQTGLFYEIAAIRSAYLHFLYLLCKDHLAAENNVATAHRGELVKTAVIYIKKHLSEPLTLDAIANHVGLNKHYLSRLFKQVLGRTVFETIRVLRCHEARKQILAGSSVSKAAHSCGFENLSYFTRIFKEYYNELPSHIRKSP